MAQRTIQENVTQNGWVGRIVERDDGKKVFLQGRRVDSGSSGSSSSGSGDSNRNDNRNEGVNRASQAMSDASERSRQQYDSLIAEQRRRQEDELRQAGERSQSSIDQFRRTVAGLENPQDIFSRVGNEFGVPGMMQSTKGLRESISSAEGQLKAMPGNVRESVRGGLVTEGQRQRLIAKESVPITEQLQVLSRTLGVESQNLSEAMSNATTQTQFAIQSQERTLEPDKLNIQAVAQLNDSRLKMFSDSASRELSGFTTVRGQELDVLAQKLQAQQTLSNQEFQQVLQLAKSEQDFNSMSKQLMLQSTLNKDEALYKSKLLSANDLAKIFAEGKVKTGLQELGAASDIDKITAEGGVKKDLIGLGAVTAGTGDERQANLLAEIDDEVSNMFDTERNQGEQDNFTTLAAYRNAERIATRKGITSDNFNSKYSGRLSPYDRRTHIDELQALKFSGNNDDPAFTLVTGG